MAFGGGRELTLLCRLYSGCARPRLWRRAPLMAALALGLGSGGCSLSYTLDSYLGGAKPNVAVRRHRLDRAAARAARTPARRRTCRRRPISPMPRAAASEVLGRGEKNASLPWENPHSGARGTVTPIASAYQQDGQTCRDFLASYVVGDAQAWLQGEACRAERRLGSALVQALAEVVNLSRSSPRKRGPSTHIADFRTRRWIPACAGMSGCGSAKARCIRVAGTPH